MFNWIRSHPYWAAFIIGPSSVVLSEALWQLYRCVRNQIRWRRAQVHEVLMFNELGFECVLEHRAHSEAGKPFVCGNVHCSERNIERIIEQLDRAKYSIDLAMYSIFSTQMVNALRKACGRSVRVRIIVSQRKGTQISNQLAELIIRGAAVRTQNTDQFMHHKFCVIDGRARVDEIWRLKRRTIDPQPTYSVVINGSVNWTQGGLGANWEDVVITSHQLLTTEFQAEFDRLWRVFAPKLNNI